MKRKKQGNSLIVVVITCMFVTTVSAATLTMVAGNYMARAAESKRIENLYSSDSGLDVAYNILGKTFDAATNYGYGSVELLKINEGNSPYKVEYKNLIDDIANLQSAINGLKNQTPITNDVKKQISQDNEQIIKDNERINELINLEFKRTFNKFVTGDYENGDQQPELADTSKNLIQYIENSSYKNVSYDKDKKKINFDTVLVDFTGSTQPTLWIPVNGEDKGDKDGIPDNFDGFEPISKDGNVYQYKVTVKSSFKTQNENEKVIGPNSRVVQAAYFITVPSYDDIFHKQESGDLHDYLALNNRALTIKGDMNVNNANKLEINGDIFVQGNPDNGSIDRVYGKYFGGITLNNSNQIIFDKNVVTRGTFNVQNDVKDSAITGDLYAGNIYAGNKDGTPTSNSKFTAESNVIIDNDLAVNASNTNIEIGHFYGINDKTIYYNNGQDDPYLTIQNGNYNEKPRSRTSSSIIINNYTDNNGKNPSSVTIDHEAYIMGTAHINTDKNDPNGGYQTGESAAVKGNYEAYSVPIEDSEKFNYYDPLQLLDESNVLKKAEHFRKYWKPNTNNGEVKKTDKEADNGGIIFKGDVHSVGAVVYAYKHDNMTETEVLSSTYTPNDISNTIIPKQIAYGKEVYKFGQEATMDDYNSLGTNAIAVSDLMNLSQTTVGDMYNLSDQLSSGEKAIFNPALNGTTKTIVIKGDNSTGEYNDANKYIIINGTNNKEVNAVIATAGDVIIDGDVTFNGSIIANGTLTVTSGNVSINYNKDIVDRIQQQSDTIHDTFFNVFGGNILDDTNNTSNPAEQTTDNTNISYDLKNFLRNGIWKIIK